MQFTSQDYSNARKILLKNVPGQYVFPEYFLFKTQKDDPAFMNLMNSVPPQEIPLNAIKNRTNNYMSNLKTLEYKSDLIAAWKQYPKFEFFQYVVTHKNMFEALEDFPQKTLDELNRRVLAKEISVEEAISSLNLTPDDVNVFITTLINDFKMGDD